MAAAAVGVTMLAHIETKTCRTRNIDGELQHTWGIDMDGLNADTKITRDGISLCTHNRMLYYIATTDIAKTTTSNHVDVPVALLPWLPK